MSQGTSPPMRQAEDLATRINHKLTASDPRFRGWCRVAMQDGSFFFYDSAFYEIHEVAGQKWLMVFAEHYPPMVVAEEDCDGYRQGDYRR